MGNTACGLAVVDSCRNLNSSCRDPLVARRLNKHFNLIAAADQEIAFFLGICQLHCKMLHPMFWFFPVLPH